jgi:hypothetical protein
MRSLRLSYGFVLAFALGTLASAQATRTWVSGVGDDANPCSRTAPCKTWAGAISKTAAGGEIDALDPGGFGALTITKSITLDGGGGQVASVLVGGTPGITVAAGATDVVIIRNIRFDGLLGNGTSQAVTPGTNGISILSAGTVILDNLDIFGFAQNGISVSASASMTVAINNCRIENVNGSGILVATSTGEVVTDVNDVRVYRAGTAGLNGGTNVSINVTGSDFSFDTIGVSTSGSGTGIDVENSQLNYNTTAGAQAAPGGTIRLVSNTLKKNGIASNLNGGNIFTNGQNNSSGNTSAGSTSGSTVTF